MKRVKKRDVFNPCKSQKKKPAISSAEEAGKYSKGKIQALGVVREADEVS